MISDLPRHLADMSPQERLEHEKETLKVLTADTIALLMEDLDVSQAELARRLGTSPANVSKLLSGSQNLRTSTVASICHALGVRMQPRLGPAPRAGTPAADDPPLPSWVGGQPTAFVTHIKLGHGAVRAARQPRPRTEWRTIQGEPADA